MEKLELTVAELRYLREAVLMTRPQLAAKLRNIADEKEYGTPSASGYSLSR